MLPASCQTLATACPGPAMVRRCRGMRSRSLSSEDGLLMFCSSSRGQKTQLRGTRGIDMSLASASS